MSGLGDAAERADRSGRRSPVGRAVPLWSAFRYVAVEQRRQTTKGDALSHCG